jgi:glycosyltransferase involved in cell wall biosynthesis
MEKVSVIMPSYNHEAYISEAVMSVLNQTHDYLELILIDDASVDSSRNIIESLASVDTRILPTYHSNNLGISKTVNEGLNKAEGEYVAFLASDDIWNNDKLERQLELLSTEGDKVLWTEGIIIDQDGRNTGDNFTHLTGAVHRQKSGDLLQELFSGNFIFGSSLILRRERLRGVKFDESLMYLSDHKFYVDLARRMEFLFIPEPLAAYRVHSLNSIFRDKMNWNKDGLRLQTVLLEEYGEVMRRRRKAGVYKRLSDFQSVLGDRAAAVESLIRALACTPENPLLWLSAVGSLTQGKGVTGRFAATMHRELMQLIRDSAHW